MQTDGDVLLARAALDVDVLIVGGGIQGLTLLEQLVDAGVRRVLLCSRTNLGLGESLHSHGYLHHGYTLGPGNAALAAELADCAAWWWPRIAASGSADAQQPPSWFGLAREDVDARLALWDSYGLRYAADEAPPQALRGGAAAHDSRQLFRIHDRTLAMRRLLEHLAAPLQDHILRSELTQIELDEDGARIRACHLVLGGGARRLLVRPRLLLLAAGRDAQPLLCAATTPDGRRPLEHRCHALNNIRLVPMFLVRGPDLPQVTAVLQGNGLSIVTHEDGGESTWILTWQKDHRTVRANFDEALEDGPEDGLRETFERLEAILPCVRDRRHELQFGFYLGAKIDHPAGGNGRFVDRCGVANLRVLWPGLWSLARANALQVLEEMSRDPWWRAATDPATPALALRSLGLEPGVTVGEERRLSARQAWWTHAELSSRLGAS